MQKISATIITFNEEKNIARCLHALQGVVDEIVVVDSFSTDSTEKICAKFGAKFVQHPFEGFIEQKNFALEQTSFSCVLSVDADEVLSEELRKSILAVKENWRENAYAFNRLTNYCGKKWIRHSSWYPDTKMRLWDKRNGVFGGKNPHADVVLQTGTHVQHLNGDLLHYTYSSINEHIARANKYTDVMAVESFRRGVKVSVLKIVYKPTWKFIRDYFVKLGVLDGYYGFVICMVAAFSTFLKYVKIRQLYLNEK